MTKTSVLITGASTGIGAVYAERFASRGHDLILVARDKTKLDALAERLRQEKGVSVDVLPADLTQAAELATVETRLREDEKIGVLINNAGIAQSGHFIGQTSEAIERLIALNVTALTRLASAAAPRFVNAGEGAIVNISSVVGLAPEFAMSIYGATEIWERAGIDISKAPEMMEVDQLVDAALAGFDRRELVTIPPLQHAAHWDDLERTRQALLADINQANVAERYKV